MLWAREHTSTFSSSSVVSTFGFAFESFKECRGVSSCSYGRSNKVCLINPSWNLTSNISFSTTIWQKWTSFIKLHLIYPRSWKP
jgi:hypothetical protein